MFLRFKAFSKYNKIKLEVNICLVTVFCLQKSIHRYSYFLQYYCKDLNICYIVIIEILLYFQGYFVKSEGKSSCQSHLTVQDRCVLWLSYIHVLSWQQLPDVLWDNTLSGKISNKVRHALKSSELVSVMNEYMKNSFLWILLWIFNNKTLKNFKSDDRVMAFIVGKHVSFYPMFSDIHVPFHVQQILLIFYRIHSQRFDVYIYRNIWCYHGTNNQLASVQMINRWHFYRKQSVFV